MEDAFKDLLSRVTSEAGEAGRYAAGLARDLAAAHGEPGFDLAVASARNSILLKVGRSVGDQRWGDMIEGALRLAARILL